MKIVLFDHQRVGLLSEDEKTVLDVTGALPDHDTGLGTPFWVRMCEDFASFRAAATALAEQATPIPIDDVVLHAPVLNPSKIIAAAANYAEHIAEMAPRQLEEWMLQFDVFLKAPSSVLDPGAAVRLPDLEAEIHYEAELAFVIGRGGRDIPAAEALDHVLGWTILLDITERGKGDRSRRKSYDGFTPIGPWLVSGDEIPDWRDLRIRLLLNGELRQDVVAGDMLVSVPAIIERASQVMTLVPGDVITTGAPPGVGQIRRGDLMEAEITGLGRLVIPVE